MADHAICRVRALRTGDAQIDTTPAAGRLVFGIFAALAEFERELIRERTLAGPVLGVKVGCRGSLGPRPAGERHSPAYRPAGTHDVVGLAGGGSLGRRIAWRTTPRT